MTKTSNKIVWEKWIDPFLGEEPEPEPKQEEESGKFKDSYEKFEETIKSIQNEKQPRPYNGPVIVGPMGVIPMTENNFPSKIYCFWIGHTNFNITPRIREIIKKSPGVESLDVFTRYRFRIAIGKAFLNDKDLFGRAVMQLIEKQLCKEENKQEEVVVKASIQDKNISLLKKHLQSKYKHWAIFKLPDGSLQPQGAATKEEILIDKPMVAN